MDPKVVAARRSESLAPTLYSIAIAFQALALSSVVLRLYVRKRILRNFGPEDIAISVAEVLSLGVSVSTLLRQSPIENRYLILLLIIIRD